MRSSLADNPWDKPLAGASRGRSVADWVIKQCPSADRLAAEWADRDWLPGRPGETVLDVGCGNGNYSGIFTTRGLSYTGVDISTEMIRAARATFPDCQFQEGDATVLFFSDNSFDYTFSHGMFYHLPLEQTKAAIAEMIRVARLAAIVGMFSMLRGPLRERTTPFGTYQRRDTIGEDLLMMREFDPDVELRVVGVKGQAPVADAFFIIRRVGGGDRP